MSPTVVSLSLFPHIQNLGKLVIFTGHQGQAASQTPTSSALGVINNCTFVPFGLFLWFYCGTFCSGFFLETPFGS